MVSGGGGGGGVSPTPQPSVTRGGLVVVVVAKVSLFLVLSPTQADKDLGSQVGEGQNSLAVVAAVDPLDWCYLTHSL